MDAKVFIMFIKAPESELSVFIFNMIKILFPNRILTWRENNCVSRQGKCKNRRNEGTIINFIFV